MGVGAAFGHGVAASAGGGFAEKSIFGLFAGGKIDLWVICGKIKTICGLFAEQWPRHRGNGLQCGAMCDGHRNTMA